MSRLEHTNRPFKRPCGDSMGRLSACRQGRLASREARLIVGGQLGFFGEQSLCCRHSAFLRTAGGSETASGFTLSILG